MASSTLFYILLSLFFYPLLHYFQMHYTQITIKSQLFFQIYHHIAPVDTSVSTLKLIEKQFSFGPLGDLGSPCVSNLIFFDQPIRTGFSYALDKDDIRHDEEGVSNDLYDLQVHFFYLTLTISRVHNEGVRNLNLELITTNLTSNFMIMRLIKQFDCESINDKLIPKCEQIIKTCRIDGGQACLFAFYFYEHIFQKIIGIVGHVNHYDIKKKCVGRYCFDLSNIEKLLNETLVNDALGIRIYTLIYTMIHYMERYFIAAPTIPFKVDGDKAKQMKNHKPLTFLNVSLLKMLQSWMQGKLAIK
ncbi:serine carboxypeptidase-like 48 [Citrus sinensis]|uniref:Serine carboxypeptidase-like 48 n=1 Tax=Citrus sinensis TaxID=2711 RepID=A0ACB8ITN7_CITSI|nr:serine carboxypeptidase-like 48 [Citrus sinensis]